MGWVSEASCIFSTHHWRPSADSAQLHSLLLQECCEPGASFRGDHPEVQPVSPGENLPAGGHEDPQPPAAGGPAEWPGRPPHGGRGRLRGAAGHSPPGGASVGRQLGGFLQVATQEHQVSLSQAWSVLLSCVQRLLSHLSAGGHLQAGPPPDQGLPVPGGADRPQDCQLYRHQVQGHRRWASQLGVEGDGSEESQESHQILRTGEVQGRTGEDTPQRERVSHRETLYSHSREEICKGNEMKWKPVFLQKLKIITVYSSNQSVNCIMSECEIFSKFIKYSFTIIHT